MQVVLFSGIVHFNSVSFQQVLDIKFNDVGIIKMASVLLLVVVSLHYFSAIALRVPHYCSDTEAAESDHRGWTVCGRFSDGDPVNVQQLHSFWTSALDGGMWSASCLGRFSPWEPSPNTHWRGNWVGPRACPCPCRISKTVACTPSPYPASHCTA